jgi:hypothetical protein
VFRSWLTRLRGTAHPILDSWVARRLEITCLYTSRSPREIAALSSYPDDIRRTLDAAERVLRHEFDLLGSGP